VNCRSSDKQGELCLEQHYSERSAQLLCADIIQGFWRGLGGGGDPFWLHRETLTFMGPAAYQNTAVFQIGVYKIPPNFNRVCDVFRSCSALKG
jgi:hypothetical protein